MIRSGRPRHWSRWLYRVQWLLLSLIGLGVVGVRVGLLDLDSAYVLFGALGLAMIVVALFSMLVFLWGLVRRHGEARTAALWAMVLGVVPVALPLFTVGQHNLNSPALYDITTDTVDPPQFDLLLSLRRKGDHSPDYPGPTSAQVQQATPAYSDIQPLILSQSVSDVLTHAEAVARELGWRVIAVKAGQGRLEAVDSTPILGITQDIVVRVRPVTDGAKPDTAATDEKKGARDAKGDGVKKGTTAETGSTEVRVDMRSASRTGNRDLGSNAARIRKFMRRLEGRAGTAQ
ncbi:DUF1499 domain-containing protein [Microbulbifer mangrovi]|uniref:DUF1499 domain-containing protein n=1 Tax=Microbulbifer mangrovi TaxID=927787 RepID=UPI0009906E9B|nr:DUF1499 domain-containing protein [Microbulbifer mangrovi]